MRSAARQKSLKWLERNREDYELLVRRPFQKLAETLKSELSGHAPGYHFPQKGIARIKRSTQKAHEHKSLYKDWLSYNVTRPSESRFEHNPSLYFVIQANEEDQEYFILAGGLYLPSSRQLRSIRNAIAQDARPFDELFRNRAFRARFSTGFSDERVATRAPRGFEPDHPRMDWIKLQAYFVWRSYSLKEASSPKFAYQVARDGLQILKLNALLDRAMHSNWTQDQPNLSLRLQDIVDIAPPRERMDF
jgi:uncharacterized protein (TIGR02453 family)